MADFDKIFSDAEVEITSIRERFIAKYIPAKPEHTPDVFEYDVKSFCILAHASFEEYIELISEAILSEVKAELLSRKISLATASLLLAYGERTIFSDEDDQVGSFTSCFDTVRLALDSCKQKHSKVIMDNHGFSLKYLKKILHPVGINAPSDEIKLESVKKLADARGSFAHTKAKQAMYGEYKKAATPLPPEDASAIVDDCLKLCESIRDAAKQRW